MANATNTLVGRSVGHEWAVSVATSGHFCWPPTGSSYWPLTLAALRAERRWRVQSGVVSKHHGFTTYIFPP